MATYLYNKENPTGKLFKDDSQIPELLKNGWVDNPSKIKEEEKEVLDRKELIAIATEMGLEFKSNISTVNLKKLIDESKGE